jgi:deoxyuridine 5'-triphosphate nucleotidohydrolase
MKVKIKKLHPDAVIPVKAHNDDFCYDVVATSCQEIAPNVYKYNTGIALQIDESAQTAYQMRDAKLCIDVRSRSSIHKTGMILSNSYGTVDAGYTGEISAVFYHVIPSLPRYQVGDRICQICIGSTYNMKFTETEALTTTDRGTGGYGSTGK